MRWTNKMRKRWTNYPPTMVSQDNARPGDAVVFFGGGREATVTHLLNGGVVLSLEDPHSIAIVEMTREGADALIRALDGPE